jgi:hypothetical protein
MDIHRNVEGLTADALADAHQKALEVQDRHGGKYHRYWYNKEKVRSSAYAKLLANKRRRLFTARPMDSLADEIIEVKEGA